MAPADLYLAHRDLIERAIASVCRRHRLSGADADDFAGGVRLHLLENDCAVLGQFQGRSTLQTYLLVVITRHFQDFRNARWGKWRPSAEAKRLGPMAVRLETLVVRDGLSLDEAHETLRTNFNEPATRQSLEKLMARFPVRSKRTFVSDQALEGRPAADSRADAPAREEEAATAARGVAASLGAVLAQLPPQDRLILRMRFEDDFGVADIARALHLEQKPLYRRLERLLADLRARLEAAGLSAAAAIEVLDERGFDLLASTSTQDGEMPGEVRLFERGGRSSIQNVRAE